MYDGATIARLARHHADDAGLLGLLYPAELTHVQRVRRIHEREREVSLHLLTEGSRTSMLRDTSAWGRQTSYHRGKMLAETCITVPRPR